MSENNELVIETLNKRLAALEAEVSRLKKTSKGVPEDVLAAICAATVLCGELSLLAAQTNPGELMRAHLALERRA